MKKIIRLWFIVLMAAVVTLLGAGCTAKVKKAYHEKRADKFFAAGDWDKAEIEYLNAFRFDMRDGKAISQLGKIYFDEGRLPQAKYFLSIASQLSTNDLDLKLKLGFIETAAGNFQGGRDIANLVLDRRPQDDQAPILLSETADNPAEVLKAKARLQQLAAAGDRASLEVALGTLALRGHDLITAQADFRRAITLNPKSPEAQSALGALCEHQNDLKSADAYFKAAADASSPRSQLRIQYAEFKIQTRDLPGAKTVLEEVVKSAPQQVPALRGLAEISFEEKKYDESDKYLKKIFELVQDDYEAMMLDGRLKIARGDAAAAVTEMERATTLYPNAERGFYQLALADMAVRQNDHAVANLQHAVDLDPNHNDLEAISLLIATQIKMNNPSRALVLLESLTKSQPKLVQGFLWKADAERELKNYSAAVEIYNTLEKSFPQSSLIQLLKGSTLMDKGDYTGARQALNRVMELHPNGLDEDSSNAVNLLVYLDLGEGQFANAQNRVQKELAKQPNDVPLHLRLAIIFLNANNRAQAEATLQKTIEIAPNDPNAYLLLAQSYYDTKQTDKALQTFNLAAQKDPKNITAWRAIATIQNAQKNYKAAAAAYEKVLAIDPKYSEALNDLAYIYSENLNRPDRAYDLAQSAHTQQPYDPSASDTLGWISVKRGDYSAALPLLQAAIAKMPDDPDVEFHFGVGNYMLDNEDVARAAFQHALQTGKEFSGHAEAERYLSILAINPQTADANTTALLEKRISEKPNDPVALQRLAMIYQRDGKLDKAISAYETILQNDKNNLFAMINVTQLYMKNHDHDKAYAMAQSAYRLAPDNAEVNHLLGQLTFQAGDYQTAFSLLSQAVRGQPNNGMAQLDFARAAYSTGKIPQTQTALQTALPNLTGPLAAEAQRMNDLINLAANPSQAVAAQSRITDILKNESDYVPALVAQQVIQDQNGDSAAAEITGEKILGLYPDFAPEQKELAQLYAHDSGKTDRAYVLAVKARANFPNDATVAKTYGIIAFQQKQYSSAVDALTQSSQQISGDGELLFYLGAAQFQLKSSQAKGTLQKALALKLTPEQTDAVKKMLTQLK